MAKMGTSYYFPSYQYSLKDHVLVKTSPVFTMARLAGKLVPGISQLDLIWSSVPRHVGTLDRHGLSSG